MLKDLFVELLQRYTDNNALIERTWNELASSYTHRKRHYHTLIHLENLLAELIKVKESIQDWDAVLLALFYHDFIYNALKNDNEEQSALLAQKRLYELKVPENSVNRSVAHIRATKSHELSDDTDTNLFTDADLSILGKPWNTYHEYTLQVRKEYSFYPDILYKPGRKMVLNHFLKMDKIFKTDLFYTAYEEQAGKNLKQELTILSNGSSHHL